MKLKKIFLIIPIFCINTSLFAADAAVLLPTLKSIYDAGTETLNSVNGFMNASLGINGLSADASILTTKVSAATTKWVPEPLQDNAQNAVQSCLQDFRQQLFSGISWPSVSICGRDIMADLKEDIADYIEKIGLTYSQKWLGENAWEKENKYNFGSEDEEKNYEKKVTQIKETISNNKNPAIAGKTAAVKQANTTSEQEYSFKKELLNYDIINYNQTLENIATISKGAKTLGINYNEALMTPANEHKLYNQTLDSVLIDTKRENQQLVNTFENIFKYKEIEENLASNKNITSSEKTKIINFNKITNQNMLKNYLVVGKTSKTVSSNDSSILKSDIEETQHNFFNLAPYYDYSNGKISSIPSGIDELETPLDTNLNYLTQARNIYKDVIKMSGEKTAQNTEEMYKRQLINLLEGNLKLQLIQIAQDYQYGKSMLNITNTNQNIQNSFLKTINDQLRLLQFTTSNINIDLKK